MRAVRAISPVRKRRRRASTKGLELPRPRAQDDRRVQTLAIHDKSSILILIRARRREEAYLLPFNAYRYIVAL